MRCNVIALLPIILTPRGFESIPTEGSFILFPKNAHSSVFHIAVRSNASSLLDIAGTSWMLYLTTTATKIRHSPSCWRTPPPPPPPPLHFVISFVVGCTHTYTSCIAGALTVNTAYVYTCTPKGRRLCRATSPEFTMCGYSVVLCMLALRNGAAVLCVVGI